MLLYRFKPQFIWILSNLIATYTSTDFTRDVSETRESQFFCSIPGKEFIDFRESRLATTWQHAYCERDNCHLTLQLAISRSLVHFAAAVACIPDTWTPRNSGVSKWYGTAYQTRFGRATTGYVDRPQAAMSTSSGTDWRAGQRSPPPPSRLHWRSNSDHAGKRYVLGRNR